MREIGLVLALLLGAFLAEPFPAGAQDPPAEAEEPAPADEGQADSERPGADEDEEKDQDAEEEQDEATDEEGLNDPSPTALRDPILAKLIKRRVLVDRPAFSVENAAPVVAPGVVGLGL